MSHKIPFKRACLILALSVVVTLGSVGMGWAYYRYIKDRHANNDAYRIVAIVQSCSSSEMLKTVYLAELLDLSIDRPTNLYRFNTKEGQSRLLASPLIKDASVKRVRPGTVFVDYVLRQPIAYLVDYTNTVIDDEGYLFPFKPFFTPKNLPEVYLGLSQNNNEGAVENIWGGTLNDKRLELALSLHKYITLNYSSDKTHVKRIDVSKAYAPSYGQRQITVVIEEQVERELPDGGTSTVLLIFPRILRMSTENFRQGLVNYEVLKPELLKREISVEMTRQKPVVIDLRLPQLGYISSS